MIHSSNTRPISRCRQILAAPLLLALAACAVGEASVDKAIKVVNAAVRPAIEPQTTQSTSSLRVCRMQVTNAPAFDPHSRQVADFRPVLEAGDDVRLLTAPVQNACLSSGYGWRNGRMHDGLDFFSRQSPPILAAGDGRIVIQAYHRDFGNMIVLDHGSQIYTLYGHLASFTDGLEVNDRVSAGTEIGVMGATGRGVRAPHLHYEILRGNLNVQSVFLLESLDPFAQRGSTVELLVASK